MAPFLVVFLLVLEFKLGVRGREKEDENEERLRAIDSTRKSLYSSHYVDCGSQKRIQLCGPATPGFGERCRRAVSEMVRPGHGGTSQRPNQEVLNQGVQICVSD